MRLDKLRGFGPWFALASPAFMIASYLVLVFIIIPPLATFCGSSGQSGHPHCVWPDWFGMAIAAWLLLLVLAVGAGLVVAVDLEWIEHPVTHTGLTYIALAAMAVAMVAVIAWSIYTAYAWFAQTPAGSIGDVIGAGLVAGLGVYLILINWVGWRAHLLGRVLPWVGVAAGAGALLTLVPDSSTSAAGAICLQAGYIAWSVWLGFKLRGKAPAAATT